MTGLILRSAWLAALAWAILTAAPAGALVEVEYRPPKLPDPGLFCGFAGFKPPEDLAVFAVTGDGGKMLDRRIAANFSPWAALKVVVNSPGRPAALFLLSSRSTIWHISWTPGTEIAAVTVAGPGAQQLAGLPGGTPILFQNEREPCQLDIHSLHDIDRPHNLLKIDKVSRQVFGCSLSEFYKSAYQQETIFVGDPLEPMDPRADTARLLTAEELDLDKYALPGLPRLGLAGLRDALARGWIHPASAEEMAQSPWRPGRPAAEARSGQTSGPKTKATEAPPPRKKPTVDEGAGQGQAAAGQKDPGRLCFTPKESSGWGHHPYSSHSRPTSRRPWQAFPADKTFVIVDERFIVPENLVGHDETAFLLAPGLPLPKIASQSMSETRLYRLDRDQIVPRLPVADASFPAWDEAAEAAPGPAAGWSRPEPPPTLAADASPDLDLPSETVIFAVDLQSGAPLGWMVDYGRGLEEGRSTRVVVNSPQVPVVLILGSAQSNIWRFGWTEGTRIAAVYLTSPRLQYVSGLPPEVPVFLEEAKSSHRGGPSDYYSSDQTNELAKRLFGRAATIIYRPRQDRQEIVLGRPVGSGTRLYTDRLFQAGDFSPPGSPGIGPAGLDQALARDWIRSATQDDIQQWLEAREASGDPVRAGAARLEAEELEHSYVVLDPRFVPPAKLNYPHYYYLPSGIPTPRSFGSAGNLRRLDDGSCCLAKGGQMECEGE